MRIGQGEVRATVDTEDQRLQSAERRGQYRVKDLEKYQITAELVVDEQTIAAKLNNLSFNGVGVAVKRGAGPVLVEQMRVFIRLLGPYLPEPIKAVAVVTFATAEGDGHRYGLEFMNARHIHDQVPSKLLGIFNRRRAFRVVPDSSNPVTVSITGRGGALAIELPVISLSVSGAACFSKGRDHVLERSEMVTLVFRLPEEAAPCRFTGTVRYLMEWQQGCRYGIEFTEQTTRLFLRCQRQVMEYVMQQQRVMLRKRSEMG
jgi:c-di-GMP-binding flagellar brake protein YcgR